MAITKANAVVEGLRVLADGSVQATVNYEILDDSTAISQVRVKLVVSNATSAEKTAAASLDSKAVALAVA
tara:strand:+ start:384 stop:593 length:210 start_codon:yes stop_codon:yes gene_type:complete